jgi:hypothetical protein
VYPLKACDLQFVNVLYVVQIRSATKSLMYRYFDYCDMNSIEIFYCNFDSILIKEKDLNKKNRYISNEDGDLKIKSRGDDKTKNRNKRIIN